MAALTVDGIRDIVDLVLEIRITVYDHVNSDTRDLTTLPTRDKCTKVQSFGRFSRSSAVIGGHTRKSSIYFSSWLAGLVALLYGRLRSPGGKYFPAGDRELVGARQSHVFCGTI